MSVRRSLTAALIATALLSAVPARAGEAADKAAAQKLLMQGNQLVGDGEYLGALEKYKAAYDKFPSPKLLVNIGSTLRQLGRNVEAAEIFEQYLRDPKTDATKTSQIQRVLQEIDSVIGRLKIEVNMADAKVRLDGKELPGFKSGTVIRVEPGDHSVVAEREGFPTAVQTLRVGPHDEKTVQLTLAPPQKIVVERAGPQKTISFIVGGVGVGGLLAGGIAGIVAVTKNQAAKGHCAAMASKPGSALICDQSGVDLGRSAKTSATVSTVALAVGGAATITGLVLYLTVPKPKPEAPRVGLRLGIAGERPFAVLEGTW